MTPPAPRPVLTAQQVADLGVSGWRFHQDRLQAVFATGNFMAGVEFINAIAPMAENANHHPDVELTYPQVSIQLTTHDAGGVTQADIDLAGAISGEANRRHIEQTEG